MQLICMQIQVSLNVPVCRHPHSVRNKQSKRKPPRGHTRGAVLHCMGAAHFGSTGLPWSSTKHTLNTSLNKQDAHRVRSLTLQKKGRASHSNSIMRRSLTLNVTEPHAQHCESLARKHSGAAHACLTCAVQTARRANMKQHNRDCRTLRTHASEDATQERPPLG